MLGGFLSPEPWLQIKKIKQWVILAHDFGQSSCSRQGEETETPCPRSGNSQDVVCRALCVGLGR